jgi:microsomal epoxide hydrolase
MSATRRELLAALALAGLPVRAQTPTPRPFTIDIPQAAIDHILARVRDTRFPARLDSTDWRYGVDWNYMRALADYWTSRYDWRAAERNLNRFPQFLARVEDFDIHFYHVKSPAPNALPLVLSHGWPGSVFEFLEVIGPLSADFDIVVPSLPGFGFSSKPPGKPVGPVTTARLWHTLMTGILGYQRYGAQGGDWGNAITTQLARVYPDSLAGIHLNAAGGGPLPEADLTDEIRAWQQTAAAYRAREIDYFGEQQNKPQTVAFALTDNPVGAAAWIVEKMKVWSDSGDDLDQTFTKDQVLTNVMLYLVTDTIGTGVWFYRGSADDRDDDGRAATGRVAVPTGFASFPREMPLLNPPEAVLRRGFNLVRYTRMPRGGHFAALEQPELFAADVRAFFKGL